MLPALSLLTPAGFPDYELLDSGHFAKLERFGQHVVARPEPQALWSPALSTAEWDRRAGATFTRAAGGAAAGEKGNWNLKAGMPEQWWLRYRLPELAGQPGPELRFRLGLSSFKHVGLFPEQEVNWRWLYARCRALGQGARAVEAPKVLNLFAYTGAASLAMRAAGADVAHLDAVRQVNFWGRENMEASGIDGIRWLVDDALGFVRRQARRGTRYQGIALDPPAYGRGPDGEKWVLEDHLLELMTLSRELLDRDRPHFFLLNLYSLGFSGLILDSLGQDLFGAVPNREVGELYLPDGAGRTLPLGTFWRFHADAVAVG
jgi:23S rRNA (cytosine1962-C5)-methyltransferase